MRSKHFKFWEKLKPIGIQSTIMIVISVTSITIMLVLGMVMYARFSEVSRQKTVDSAQTLMEQTRESLEDYLISMRRISDALYYNVVKENDLSDLEKEIHRGMNLLYEANRDNLRSIAIYDNRGELIAAEPIASQKERPNVTQQDWYVQAVSEMENLHFSTPHIQNLFTDTSGRYYWVISLSRVVELTEQGVSKSGVLLVDMDFSGIERMMKQSNRSGSGQYYYLCDSNGEIIYHPRQIQIGDGIYRENNAAVAGYKDGVHDETFGGDRRKIIVSTVSYTGWKLVGVIPHSTFPPEMMNLRYYLIMLMVLTIMMLMAINRVVSVRISRPILKLNNSVLEYETGAEPSIYIGGSVEIRHLGHSIQRSYEQIDTLMREIVWEQNKRRKSELDALQSQINPHFLYNTLESITWMIEGERNDEAVFMISQLAKLFRISLSKGQTVISIKDELQHARSYMNIQKVRYKDAFSIVFDVEPEIESYCTVKLILQPLLENAINYGVGAMYDCGEILVSGRMDGEDIILAVADNGLGMSEEEVALVLTDSKRIHKHGSGVGLVNVNNRIQILFGRRYGLTVESEPDEGTTVSIRLPAVPYNEENQKILEKGHMFNEADKDEK